eukprot:4802016-Amphidinium_carterae.1
MVRLSGAARVSSFALLFDKRAGWARWPWSARFFQPCRKRAEGGLELHAVQESDTSEGCLSLAVLAFLGGC